MPAPSPGQHAQGPHLPLSGERGDTRQAVAGDVWGAGQGPEHRGSEIRTERIKVRKIPLPPLVVKRVIRTVVRDTAVQTAPLHLIRPDVQPEAV